MRNGKTLFTVIAILSLALIAGCFEDCEIAKIEEQNKALILRIHSEVSNGDTKIFDEVL